MKHYKDEQNNIYAYEADGSQDAYIKPNLVLLSDAELIELRQPTQQQIAEAEKAQALAELTALDLASIRALREYVASKADAPKFIKDKEAAAILARGKLAK